MKLVTGIISGVIGAAAIGGALVATKTEAGKRVTGEFMKSARNVKNNLQKNEDTKHIDLDDKGDAEPTMPEVD